MATEVTKVAAQDGQVYEFGEKAKVKKQSYIAQDGSVVTKFVFRNGVIKEHVTPRDSEIFTRLAVHGADQKFGDEFAGLEDVEDCIEAFDQMSGRLSRGEWSEKRQSEGLAGTSLLARALVEVTGQPIAAVKERLAATSKEMKQALAKQTKVAEVIYRLKSERDAKKGKIVDADAALDAFLS